MNREGAIITVLITIDHQLLARALRRQDRGGIVAGGGRARPVSNLFWRHSEK